MYFLYVLKSTLHNHTYIGVTANVEKRLAEHNRGIVRSTKFYTPYNLTHFETFATKTEARRRELELKRNSSKKEALFKSLNLI